ncbi:MAG: hypothetical protein WB698_03965 [Solirubrobacteraceae bacterium]
MAVSVISLIVGGLSLGVGMVGLTIAFRQLRKVGTVADAAAATAARNEKQVSGAVALSRIPDLERTTSALRSVANSGDRERAKEYIHDWGRYAPEYQALLASAGVSDPALDEHLEMSLGLVEETLGELDNIQIAPEDACRYILRHMGPACRDGRRIATAMMVSTSL